MNISDSKTEYWFARNRQTGWRRASIGIVHWKGFLALFGTIMGCIWLLLGGVLLVVFGLTEFNAIAAKVGATIVGIGLVIAAAALAWKLFKFMRKRIDPLRTASDYYRDWFCKEENTR